MRNILIDIGGFLPSQRGTGESRGPLIAVLSLLSIGLLGCSEGPRSALADGGPRSGVEAGGDSLPLAEGQAYGCRADAVHVVAPEGAFCIDARETTRAE
jgi:hypothetical protein